MSAPFIVPFNHCPVSVSVITSSYTVPSGKYAKVVAECDSGGIVTLNGSNAITTAAFVNVDVTSSSTATYTVPSNYRASVCGATAAADTFVINGNVGGSIGANAYTQAYDVGPGGTFATNFTFLSGSGTRAVQGVAIPSNATNRQAEFFLPAGTVLSGSGNWRAVLMLYNVIS